jgi:hypothetical protein
VDDEPISLLLARKLGDGVEPSELERVFAPEVVSRLRVGPLSAGAIQRLLEDRLARALRRPMLLQVHEASGGNPFFAFELTRALVDAGADAGAGAPLPVPETLRGLVGGRLAVLSAPARRALLAAAASARQGRALLPCDALDEAVDADVLVLDGEQMRFTHPLLASVLYADARPGERRAVHGRPAALVTDPVEAARHLALATREPNESTAARIEAAAAQARARGAPAAAELMEQAVALTPRRAVTDRVRRTLEAARYHVDAGADRAEPLVASVLPATRGTDRARALRLLGLHRRERETFGAEYDLLREALRHVEDDRLLEAEIWLGLVNPLFNQELDLMEDGARARSPGGGARPGVAGAVTALGRTHVTGVPWARRLAERADGGTRTSRGAGGASRVVAHACPPQPGPRPDVAGTGRRRPSRSAAALRRSSRGGAALGVLGALIPPRRRDACRQSRRSCALGRRVRRDRAPERAGGSRRWPASSAGRLSSHGSATSRKRAATATGRSRWPTVWPSSRA